MGAGLHLLREVLASGTERDAWVWVFAWSRPALRARGGKRPRECRRARLARVLLARGAALVGVRGCGVAGLRGCGLRGCSGLRRASAGRAGWRAAPGREARPRTPGPIGQPHPLPPSLLPRTRGPEEPPAPQLLRPSASHASGEVERQIVINMSGAAAAAVLRIIPRGAPAPRGEQDPRGLVHPVGEVQRTGP